MSKLDADKRDTPVNHIGFQVLRGLTYLYCNSTYSHEPLQLSLSLFWILIMIQKGIYESDKLYVGNKRDIEEENLTQLIFQYLNTIDIYRHIR